jgi:hypothetical protein
MHSWRAPQREELGRVVFILLRDLVQVTATDEEDKIGLDYG